MNAIMTENINALSGYIVNFLFILLRAGIFVALMPVFGDKKFPGQFRMGLAVFISLLLTPVVHFEIRENEIPLIVLKELLIATALGLTVRLIFMAINVAGHYISHTVGMSMARVFNPEMGQSTVIAEVYGIMAMLLFLAMNAHHDLIIVFVKSFEILPAGQINIAALVPVMMSMGSKFFVISMKIAAPVIVGLLISHLLTGFLYKAAPQMNIFFIAWPLNLFLGFLLILLSLPVFEHVVGINFSDMRREMIRVISFAKGQT
jgi:flagellar biosynthetic protein FliR